MFAQKRLNGKIPPQVVNEERPQWRNPKISSSFSFHRRFRQQLLLLSPQASPSPSPVGYSPMTPGAPSPGGYNPHTPGSNIEQGSSDWVTTDILVRVKDSFMDLMGQTGVIRSITVTNTPACRFAQPYNISGIIRSVFRQGRLLIRLKSWLGNWQQQSFLSFSDSVLCVSCPERRRKSSALLLVFQS